MQNQIVLHYSDGRIIKGSTRDFSPDKPEFHLKEKDTERSEKVDITALKGIFFVKDYEGNPKYGERHDIERKGLGTKVKVCFRDGETIIGYTTGTSPERTGFFLFPADPHSNTEKIFVIQAATEEIRLL
jgi:hypothetical protein